jgi:uncharacterized repeat protein (TIGR01451 family)
MKHVLLLVLFAVFGVAGLDAQQSKKGAVVEYSQFALSAFPQPNASAAQAAVFLGGRLEKGKKELFGLTLGTSPSPAIEFLDAGNKVVKSLSAGDLLGKSSVGAKLLRTSGDEMGARSEAVYEIAFPQGKSEFTIRSLASAAAQGSKAKIVMSFSLKGNRGDVAGIRIALPVEGQATAQENGFIIGSKTLAADFSVAVFPKPKSVTAEKNILTIIGAVASGAQSNSEQPLLWMIVEGSSASNPAAAKTEAAASLKTNAQYAADPNLVIVTTANKVNTTPTDTVTYVLVCTNIGLGNATDVVLSNPIPAGTTYLEESATGAGTEIILERENASAPQRGAVKTVKWKLTEPLMPGAEKIVSFKIIIR